MPRSSFLRRLLGARRDKIDRRTQDLGTLCEALLAEPAEFAGGALARDALAAYQALDEATMDPEGKESIKGYMDAFFAAIETDDGFYRPVVIDAKTRLFADAAATRPVCNGDLALRGMPVSAPLETSGGMIRVVVLDALWQWGTAHPCDVIRTGPVWIASTAVSRDYP